MQKTKMIGGNAGSHRMTGLYAMGQKMKETKKIKIQNCQYVQCQSRKYKTVKEISIMKTISQHAIKQEELIIHLKTKNLM